MSVDKPVDQEIFWKERIDYAKEHGKLHFSVFLAHDLLWRQINADHERIIKEHVKDTDKVLDAGCAYGRMSEIIPGDYTGIDFSPDFIEEAKKLYPNKNFLVADLKNLPFKDKEFDIAVLVSIRHMIIGNLGQEVWDQMEKELKRTCKKVLILEYGVNDKDNKLESSEYILL